MGQTIRKYRTVGPNSELPLLLHKKITHTFSFENRIQKNILKLLKNIE